MSWWSFVHKRRRVWIRHRALNTMRMICSRRPGSRHSVVRASHLMLMVRWLIFPASVHTRRSSAWTQTSCRLVVSLRCGQKKAAPEGAASSQAAAVSRRISPSG